MTCESFSLLPCLKISVPPCLCVKMCEKGLPVKLATLVYVREGGRTLMLHRIRKANDMHAGKWNGLGGKLEPGETPEACAVREVHEESGLTIVDPEFRGMLTFPAFAKDEDWIAYLFVARRFSGSLIDSAEGVLEWVDDRALLQLPLWPGDRIFLPWLDEEIFFSGRFDYEEGLLLRWEATHYGAGGRVVRRLSGSPQEEIWRYTAREDSYCWVCGAAVTKRNCKIICAACGFTRDCSDP